MKHLKPSSLSAACLLGLGLVLACSGGGSSGPPVEPVGSACSTAAQCYPMLDAGSLRGEVTCLTQLTNGYCTHTCQSDTDCCSAAGECPSGFKEVCAPFESTAQSYCFLSCNASDLPASPDGGAADANLFCQTNANATFTCRSTGGGSANRKFCGP